MPLPPIWILLVCEEVMVAVVMVVVMVIVVVLVVVVDKKMAIPEGMLRPAELGQENRGR